MRCWNVFNVHVCSSAPAGLWGRVRKISNRILKPFTVCIHTTSVPSNNTATFRSSSSDLEVARVYIHAWQVTMMFSNSNACDSECIVSVLQVWVEISCFWVRRSKFCYSLWDHLVLACPVQQLFIRGIEVATDLRERGTVLGCGIPNEREKREIDVWN